MAGDTVERKLRGLTVRIDRTLCIASANCMVDSPDLFEFDDENVCAFGPGAASVERDELIRACKICPVEALIVLDEDGKPIVP